MAFADYVKSLLLSDISSIARNPHLFVNHPGRDFTRNRKISLQNLMEFYICLESGNLQHELLKYFYFRSDTATVSAFHQQRSKLKPEAFLYLLKQFIKGLCTKSSYLQKHSLRCPQKNIRPADRLCISQKADLTILHLGDFIAQIVDFSFQHCLQAKMAGGNQFICFHDMLSLMCAFEASMDTWGRFLCPWMDVSPQSYPATIL